MKARSDRAKRPAKAEAAKGSVAKPRATARAKAAMPAVILVKPQLGENIGFAARAMANFGLSDLFGASYVNHVNTEKVVQNTYLRVEPAIPGAEPSPLLSVRRSP